MVTVAFAVTDLAKAKAFLASKDLKDKMSAAGVEGPPAFFFYKVTESY
jgi:predicted house-cleaning NTP pyrophosphatase (Maf/HAM1 superfamily)